jgi:hypothetical protein
MTAPAAGPDTVAPSLELSPHRAVIAAALAFGLLCGAFEITNTAIGWHITSGLWMLDHHQVLDRDVFSFTAAGTDWIDHEWLFQIVAAGLYRIGGAPALVVMRMVAIAALTLLLLRIGIASGLDPPVALALACASVMAARPRFFVRPELATLLLVPLALWLFASRRGRRLWPLSLAGTVVVGVNLHGAVLVAPILLAVWFAGEVADGLLARQLDPVDLQSGAFGLAAAIAATLVNPRGVAIWTVPVRLGELVRQPHIPNPEWIPPGPSDAPWLYASIVAAVVTLAFSRRAPQGWLLGAATAALALKHIRNIGLFFVVLPLVVAPALARWRILSARPSNRQASRRAIRMTCIGLVAVLAAAAVSRPWPRPGFGFADRWYPDRAVSFLKAHGLLGGRLYNDVRFGGWLILDGYPERQVFLDDRNEIHEPLLREIWEIFATSNVAAWEDLLERWHIDTVLLRYHEPIRVTTPDGAELGERGFSQLWFPTERWAMVYWDDVAMVVVRRSAVPAAFVADHEYRILHPDDLDHVLATLSAEPNLLPAATAELRRALADDPECRRALTLGRALGSIAGKM